MKKISKHELLAILAAVGVSGSSCAYAADSNSNDSFGKTGFEKTEQSGPTKLGDESKCGKGSCGTDEKGAAAAQEKQKKKEAKKSAKKAEKKSEKKEEKKSAEGN